MNTEEAIDRGIEFLEDKAGYYTHKLESVKFEENVWVMRFDVGAFEEKIAEVKMDDKTERINITSHVAFFDFTRDISKELRDEEFHKSVLAFKHPS